MLQNIYLRQTIFLNLDINIFFLYRKTLTIAIA